MNKLIENKPISSKNERIKRTPLTNPKRGYWLGERGCSTYIPANSQKEILSILQKFGLIGISYIDGIVDFRECSFATVILAKMSTQRSKNFSMCDQLCAELWNKKNHTNHTIWTSRLVKEYRKKNSLTWHERNDRITCDLVPAKINFFFSHLGGIAECKRAKIQFNIS